MLLHVVHWMLSNTLLPVGRNQVSGIIEGVAKPTLPVEVTSCVTYETLDIHAPFQQLMSASLYENSRK